MESRETSNNRSFFITAAGGIIGSLLIGLLFLGTSIFSFFNPRFVILAIGITGALVFSCLKYRTLRDSVFVTILILFLNVIGYRASPLSWIFRDIVLFAGLWLCMFLYWRWLKRINDKYMFIRAFGLAAIAALILMASGLILVLVNVPFENIGSKVITPLLFFYLRSGVIAGLGLGLGLDAADIFMGIEKKNAAKESIDTN